MESYSDVAFSVGENIVFHLIFGKYTVEGFLIYVFFGELGTHAISHVFHVNGLLR